MPRIDFYLGSLQRFDAEAAILQSGANVCFRFPGGDRHANQTTPHEQVVAIVEEIAPPEEIGGLMAGVPATFPYQHGGRRYNVTVEPRGKTWRVIIAPEAAAGFEIERNQVAPEPVRAPAPVSTQGRTGIDQLLVRMLQVGASDLHLSTASPPYVRVHGEIRPLGDDRAFDEGALLDLLRTIMPEKNRREFEERSDTDFAHAIPGASRFRVNVFRDRKGPGAVVRAIPYQIMSPEEIALPKGVLDLCFLTKGLVLVTGPTGSGKSTTLATLVDQVNRHRKDHVITIEDPIEFVHENKSCIVNQREVHSHTRSFKDALRAALREDPDVVLVGEMRDLETIAIAVETAETGHLVFGTLHTTTAASTIDRIIDQFSADRQEQIRQMLAESLRGVIAQTLCRRIGGGRVAAYEILIGTSAVANIIRERKTFQLPSLMQTARSQGMSTLNDALLDLVRRRVIEPREAWLRAAAKTEIKQQLVKEGLADGLGDA